MLLDIDPQAMREYILKKFGFEGDFDFLKKELMEEMVDEMISIDHAYMEQLGEDEDYDDDAVYDIIFAAMQKKYPEYKMYAMRLSEDYLDFAEEYLASIDAIEWE